MRYIWPIIVALLCFLPNALFSDMGAIIPVESVKLDEPAQRAVIAFDGFEEILILQTELKSSNSSTSKVLRFIPLPSIPKVTAGSTKILIELKKLVKSHDMQYIRQTKSLAPTTEKIKIEIMQTIGAHDITVVRVYNTAEFTNWVKRFLKHHGYNYSIKNNHDYIDVIHHYINNKINYFVFDIVNLEKHDSIQPIVYIFKTNTLYYPLVATNILKSYGTIELFIFSENGRRYLSSVYGFMPSTTAVVDTKEMAKVHPEIASLLGKHGIFQAFKYSGKLYFSKDINENSGVIIIKPRINQLMLQKKYDKQKNQRP